MFGMVALQAQGFQVFQAVRLGAFDMMYTDSFRGPTSYALEVIPHFRPESQLSHLQRFVARFCAACRPYSSCEDAFIWAYDSHRIVLERRFILKDVWMAEAALTLLHVPGTL